MDQAKTVLNKLIEIWKNKTLFRRAIESVVVVFLLLFILLGSHTCKFLPYPVISYTSPIELWRHCK
jgi:hypothetical protein